LYEEELALLEKLYDLKYKIIDTYYVKVKPYLKDIVEELFVAKQEASRNGNAALKTYAKLNLNNMYGKLGQSRYKSQTFIGKREDIDLTKYRILSEKLEKCVVNGESAFNIAEIKEDTCIEKPVHVAAYITSQARISLVKQYLEIRKNGNVFLYADTDSIAYIEKNPQTFSNIGDNLGD
jgi:hypothetical protein